MQKLTAVIAFVAFATLAALHGSDFSLSAQSTSREADLLSRIEMEGLTGSHVTELARHLTDVIGPRLTGSPAMRQANDWTASKLREWGISNVTVEPWGEFGRGWENVLAYARILTPYAQPLPVSPWAWTGSTNGPAIGPAVAIEANTAEEVLARYTGRLRGAWVMMTPPRDIPPDERSQPPRHSIEALLGTAPVDPAKQQADRAREEQLRMEGQRAFRRNQQVHKVLLPLMQAEGAHGMLSYSARPYAIHQQLGWMPARAVHAPIPLPDLVIGIEQYGQVWRNVTRGVPVTVEAHVQNRFHEADLNAYNTFGEIPGADKRDEYLVVGAHLDSWHGGTGATDNAAGVVIMLEAMRILRQVDAAPRRTIRAALWSGEEQGMLGSAAWLKNNPHLHAKISAYLNVDNGSGRIRGIRTEGHDACVDALAEAIAPLRHLGVVSVRKERTAESDQASFNRLGVPGFIFIQDPLDYWDRTHHTNVDRYERLVFDDLKQAAVVVASTALALANREEMMPCRGGVATNATVRARRAVMTSVAARSVQHLVGPDSMVVGIK